MLPVALFASFLKHNVHTMSFANEYNPETIHVPWDSINDGPTAPKVQQYCSEDGMNGTFRIKGEDHTLGNSLRYVLARDRNIDFAAYTVPHPHSDAINIRIQANTKNDMNINAQQLLTNSCSTLMDICTHVLSVYTLAVDDYKNKQLLENMAKLETVEDKESEIMEIEYDLNRNEMDVDSDVDSEQIIEVKKSKKKKRKSKSKKSKKKSKRKSLKKMKRGKRNDIQSDNESSDDMSSDESEAYSKRRKRSKKRSPKKRKSRRKSKNRLKSEN